MRSRLRHGTIAERGRHSELVAKGGPYAAMWNRQKEAAARERLRAVENDSDVGPELAREPAAAE